jgi:hypothetical protein
VPFAVEEAVPVQPDDPNSWLARQAEFSSPRKQPRRNPRGKAAAHRASAVEPAKPTLSPPPHPTDPNKNQKPQNKKRLRNKTKKAKNNNMAGPSDGRASVYVPPHLRNRSTVDGGKRDSAHGSGIAVNESPATSNQSKAANNGKPNTIS